MIVLLDHVTYVIKKVALCEKLYWNRYKVGSCNFEEA